MALAPITVFAYKRPEMLRQTLRSLAANDGATESHLIVYCDGPKAEATGKDHALIDEVRAIAETATGFANVEVIGADTNKGLARSVIDGVSEVLTGHGKVIVVEDDVALSPHFLRFMNDALDTYAAEERVGAVGSWNYFADPERLDGNFFLRYPDSIAWATWQRSWARFEQDGQVLWDRLNERGLMQAFDADGALPYFSHMLREQIKGNIDSWAIRWTANSVLNETLNLFPKVSLSRHMGFGEGATHETGEVDYNKELMVSDARIAVERKEPVESAEALAQWVDYAKRNFRKTGGTSLKARVWGVLPQGMKQWYVRRRSSTEATPKALEFEPVSRVFGIDRGKPVDRYYIEHFLKAYRSMIAGQVMEIEDDLYTRMFGSKDLRSEVLRFSGEAGQGIRIGDLTRPETLPAAEVDAFICTQTLNFVYDVKAAIQGLHHSLKPGGLALVTLAGLVQVSRYDADRWGDLWRFTPQSAQRLFEDVFGKEHVEVEAYGNSYAASCIMKGFATEECDTDLLDKPDPDYPVVITIVARKRP